MYIETCRPRAEREESYSCCPQDEISRSWTLLDSTLAPVLILMALWLSWPHIGLLVSMLPTTVIMASNPLEP